MKGFVRFGVILIAVGGLSAPAAMGGEPESEGEAFIGRLMRPDRQAMEVLRLFEGARWRDPAAAMAAWKLGSPDAGLGKPAEALIALFNPEMAAEWRALDGAEIRIGPDPPTGELGWSVVIPRDDGTLAGAITAMRLTYPDDRPLVVGGVERPVARLGRSGVPMACQIGSVIVVAGSRARLERGVAIARAGRPPLPPHGDEDSGTVFRLEPDHLSSLGDGSPWRRRAVEAFRALGCRRVEGVASLRMGRLEVDISTTLEGRRPVGAVAGPLAVELAWLEALPSEGLLAAFSTAVDSDPASWDRAFAAADRVERVDPARAGLAPLRSRLNLLAMGAGLKLEADLRPHLRGVSVCAFGEPSRPGRVAGALFVLHLDEPDVAARLARQVRPRLAGLSGNEAAATKAAVWPRDRDLSIAWGAGLKALAESGRPAPGLSLAQACGGWAADRHRPPARVGAVWPARIWRPDGIDGAASRALAADPPVVWWGWSEPDREHDLLRWAGLEQRVRDFLAALPGDRPAAPGARDPQSPTPAGSSSSKGQGEKP